MAPPIRKVELSWNCLLQRNGGMGPFRGMPEVLADCLAAPSKLTTYQAITELGCHALGDFAEHGYMLVQLPEYTSRLVTPLALQRTLLTGQGLQEAAGKQMLVLEEPFEHPALGELAGCLAALSRLLTSGVLAVLEDRILSDAAVQLLQPLAAEGERPPACRTLLRVDRYHSGAAEEQGALAPHVDGGLLTVVTCPWPDRCLRVEGPRGPEQVPLQQGVAAVLPGAALARVAAGLGCGGVLAAQHCVCSPEGAGQRTSVTLHLRPHPAGVMGPAGGGGLGGVQTAGEFMASFDATHDSINAAPAGGGGGERAHGSITPEERAAAAVLPVVHAAAQRGAGAVGVVAGAVGRAGAAAGGIAAALTSSSTALRGAVGSAARAAPEQAAMTQSDPSLRVSTHYYFPFPYKGTAPPGTKVHEGVLFPKGHEGIETELRETISTFQDALPTMGVDARGLRSAMLCVLAGMVLEREMPDLFRQQVEQYGPPGALELACPPGELPSPPARV